MNPILIDGYALEKLYRDDGLSTYKIATKYKCDPKTVYRYLKLYGISTRPRKRILLSRTTLRRLYTKERKSLKDIADRHEYSPAGILKKLKQFSITRRSAFEANIKHIKNDFDKGAVERAYLIGFRIGDLGVRRRGNLIYISSGTTKVAQSRLIRNLFYKYGPVWISRNKSMKSMNISCSLNNSFSFLIPKHQRIPKWVMRSQTVFFSFVAGYTDAEGNICIANKRARFRLRSCDRGILRDIHSGFRSYGLESLFGLDRKAGTNSRGARLNKDCWFLTINDMRMLYKLLMILLPLLRHAKRRDDAKNSFANVNRRVSQ